MNEWMNEQILPVLLSGLANWTGMIFREINNSETKKRNEIGGVSTNDFNEALHIRIYIAMIAKKAAARLAFVRTFISYVISYQR